MRRATPSRRSRGFTLVEMLVAVLVFALLSAAGVAVLVQAADHQAAVGARLARLGEFQRARALLQADLSQVAVRRVRHPDGGAARDAFVGRAVRADDPSSTPLLGFVRRGWSNPDALPRASLQYVEYRLVDGRLERSTRPMLDGAPSGTPQGLLTGVSSARLAYLDRGQWSDGWPGGATAHPEALRLELELDGIGRIAQLFLLPGDER